MTSAPASAAPGLSDLMLDHADDDPRGLDWPIVVALGGTHLLALAAFVPQFFTWSGLFICLFLWWVTGGIGITLCFHRLLTHRSFKTPRWFELFLTACACLAWQGGPIQWVGMHRLHHKHSDGEHDPHSPQHGFSWAHILWMLHKNVGPMPAKDAAKDLQRDKAIALMDKFFWVPQVIVAAVLVGVGWAWGGPLTAVSWFVWGIAIRTVLVFHVTWFVNSASHTWGYQNFKDTGEHSTNLWWVALLSFGEGWHNNHHAHPRSARHGMRWYEFDITWLTIKALSLVGLAKEVKLPTADEMPR